MSTATQSRRKRNALQRERRRLDRLHRFEARAHAAGHLLVGGIDEMFEKVEKYSPLRRNIDGDEVGKTAVYLLSDLSSGVTGTAPRVG